MMMMWMMTRSPALFVLLSLSATTTSVTGLSVRRNSLPLGEGHQVGEWRQVITEDLDDTAMDSKAKSELLELAAKEYKGLADKASEAKVAITEVDKAPPASARSHGLLGAGTFAISNMLAQDGVLASHGHGDDPIDERSPHHEASQRRLSPLAPTTFTGSHVAHVPQSRHPGMMDPEDFYALMTDKREREKATQRADEEQ